MELPSRILVNAVESVSQLPGIGKRSALRLVLHLLQRPKSQTHQLATALAELVDEITYCKQCHNISDTEICLICANSKRDQSIICIVEDVRDVMAIENTAQYKGVYHVLGGKISPIDGIGPGDIEIDSLLKRVKHSDIKEIVFAMSSTIEGDTTNYYIYKQVSDFNVNVTTVARGIAIGDEIQYADEVTLGRSIISRIPFENSL